MSKSPALIFRAGYLVLKRCNSESVFLVIWDLSHIAVNCQGLSCVILLRQKVMMMLVVSRVGDGFHPKGDERLAYCHRHPTLNASVSSGYYSHCYLKLP